MTGIEIVAIEGLVFAGLSAVHALLVSNPCFIPSLQRRSRRQTQCFKRFTANEGRSWDLNSAQYQVSSNCYPLCYIAFFFFFFFFM